MLKLKHQCPECWVEIQFPIPKEMYDKNISFSCGNCRKLFVYYTKDGKNINIREVED
jgi:hypothetical protein